MRRTEVNGHRADAEPSVRFDGLGFLADRRHRPGLLADIAEYDLAWPGWMRFHRRHDGVVITVTGEVMRGEGRAFRQHYRRTLQFEQRWSRRHLVAVPAPHARVVW